MDRPLERFIIETSERDVPASRFGLESERVLRIELNGGAWLRPGAAVAHRGDVSFERLRTIDAGSVTDAALRELTPLVRASGRGRVYCGNHAWHVQIVRLSGETIFVSWVELLAFEDSLQFELCLVDPSISLPAGGLVMVKLTGHGAVAFAAHGTPLTLPVAPGHAVRTDPHATVAWSGSLSPTLKTDITWRTAFGHGGQEPIQMFFEGTGFVVVQPFEDPRRLSLGKKSLEPIVSALSSL